MNHNEYDELSDEEKRRHLAANRLESDRREALRGVNEMFDERARRAAAFVEMDQATAQRFVAMAQGVAHMAAGYETVSLAFRHDQPESRDALKMVLRTFRESVSLYRYTKEISTATIDRWLYGLDLLARGIVLPAFEKRVVRGPKTIIETDQRNIKISFWYAYLKGLHPNNSSESFEGQLANYFERDETTIQKLARVAVDQFGLIDAVEFYETEGCNLQWPCDLAGDNPGLQQAFIAHQEERWAAMGDDWHGYISGGESQREWRKMLIAALDEHLKGQWENP